MTSGERLEREVESEEADLAVQLADRVGGQKDKAGAQKERERPAAGDGGKAREEVKTEWRENTPLQRTENSGGTGRDSAGKQAEQKPAESKRESRVNEGVEKVTMSTGGEKSEDTRKEERREVRKEERKVEAKEERKAVRIELKKEKGIERKRSTLEKPEVDDDITAMVEKVSPRKQSQGNKRHKDSTKSFAELGMEDIQLVVNPRAWLRRGRGGRQQQQHGKQKVHEQPHGREQKQDKGREHQQKPKRVQEIEMEKQIKEAIQQHAEREKRKDGGGKKEQGSQELPEHFDTRQRGRDGEGGARSSDESQEKKPQS